MRQLELSVLPKDIQTLAAAGFELNVMPKRSILPSHIL